MTVADPPGPERVTLTLTAREKCYRLLPSYEIKRRVAGLHGTCWRRKESDEYHLVTKYPTKRDGTLTPVALVFKPNWVDGIDGRVVITQMHEHIDYRADSAFEYGKPPGGAWK